MKNNIVFHARFYPENSKSNRNNKSHSMKNRFENEENFTAYATIEAGIYMMRKATEDFNKQHSKGGINLAIDRATGFAAHQEQEYVKYMIICLEDIIEAKKVIEDDYSKDEKTLNQLKTFIRPKKETVK